MTIKYNTAIVYYDSGDDLMYFERFKVDVLRDDVNVESVEKRVYDSLIDYKLFENNHRRELNRLLVETVQPILDKIRERVSKMWLEA